MDMISTLQDQKQPDKKTQRYQSLLKETLDLVSGIASNMGFFGALESGIVDDYRSELASKKAEVEKLAKSWKVRKRSVSFDTNVERVFIPYMRELCESVSARLELSRAGRFRKSDESFMLNMQAENLGMDELSDVVDVYHDEAEKMLGLQREATKAGVRPINTDSVLAYESFVGYVKHNLDQLAMQLFNKRITTPSNIDLKERNPHQFLGRINIGYEGFAHNLVMVLGHEGALGHNSHQLISEDSVFQMGYRHTKEGLAILGENIALDKMFGAEDGPNRAVLDYLRSRRRKDLALISAYEKLAFYDRLAYNDIASRLKCELHPEELLRQNLFGLDERRENAFGFFATPYHVGARKVSSIYGGAMDALRQKYNDDAIKDAETMILRRMFTGYRSAEIVKAQVDLEVENFHRPEHEITTGVGIRKEVSGL